MKLRLLAFIFFVSFVLLAIPVINIFTVKSYSAIKLEKSFLFNMDFVSRWTAVLLYPLGISTDPKQVIVGRNGWLYLGNKHEATVSEDMRLATDDDRALGKQIGAATLAWEAYLKAQGVKLFRIMIGPNKSSIYPENMPSWARPASFNPMDALIAEAKGEVFVDLRPALLSTKYGLKDDLYFKTDTHWNALGAGVGFRYFGEEVGKVDSSIVWPSGKVYELINTTERGGGDLANFLRLSGSFSDPDPRINSGFLRVQTSQVDYETGKLLWEGGNPEVGAPYEPLLIKSDGALNTKKVLWLRDSFGSSLSPLMAVTFSDVIQLHWSQALKPGGSFTKLVEEWKPDYVFITVVERAVRSAYFEAYPPPVFMGSEKNYKVVSSTQVVSANMLMQGPAVSDYKINGIDAFVDYALKNEIPYSTEPYLGVNLVCNDGSSSVPVQLFWVKEGEGDYSESSSAKFTLRTGASIIDLRTIPKWPVGSAIKRLRIDIDSMNYCVNFKMNNPSILIKE